MSLSALSIKLFCLKVGTDQYNNQYFISKGKNYLGKNKRYVIYAGKQDGSRVPPGWHAWLHYLSDEVPENIIENNKYKWQKQYEPNLSGTEHCYNPSVNQDRDHDNNSRLNNENSFAHYKLWYKSWQP